MHLFKHKSKGYKLIAKSKFFDKRWYLKTYPDVAAAGIDPVEHYLEHGWQEGRKPSSRFDVAKYVHANHSAQTMNPVLHYELFNQHKKRSLANSDAYKKIKRSKYFDKKWYLKTYPDVARAGVDPVEHYLLHGWREGKNPSRYFNTQEYLDINIDVKKAGINPLAHYLTTFQKENRQISLKMPMSPSKQQIEYCQRARNSKHNKVETILLVSHELTYTGAPLSLLKSAELLTEMGYKVKVVSLKPGDLDKEFQKYGTVRIAKTMDDIWQNAMDCDFAIVNTLICYAEYEFLRQLMPTVWWLREPGSTLDAYKYKYAKVVLRNARNVYAMSYMSRDEFLPYNSGISVIKHGIDDEYKNKAIDTKHISFAVIGSIVHNKGQDVFAKAIRLLPAVKRAKAKFYVVGKVNNQEYLNSLQSVARGALTVLDPITDHKRMLKFYEKISCAVIPSRAEATSRIAIEAMMMGRPVLMSSRVGAQYLMNGKNGAIFENEDAKALSKMMAQIIDRPQTLKYMSAAARKAYKQNNSIEKYKENLQKTIDDVCAQPICSEKKLLVHLHLFYHDQLDFFISKLKNITCDYDLFVTYVEKNLESEAKLKKFNPAVHLIHVPNKGYDLAPFITVLNKVNLDDYDYIIKVHTKNSRNTYWSYRGINYIRFQWRDALVNALMGSKKIFKDNLQTLKRVDVGMIGNTDLLAHGGAKANEGYRKRLLKKLNYNPKYDMYIAGTMFMCKAFLMRDIQNLHLTMRNFEYTGSTGAVGTLAHALESVLGHAAQNCGTNIVGRKVWAWNKVQSKIRQYIIARRKKKKLTDYQYIKKSKMFNKRWYLRAYPDVAKAKIDPVEHYLKFGWRRGYNPSQKFDSGYYLKRYKDVAAAGVCPLLHYEKYGKYEGRECRSNNICENAVLIKRMHKAHGLAITTNKRSPRIIVSITTFPERVNEVVFAIYSIMRQTIKPDEIVLWLGTDKFKNKDKDLPQQLLAMKKRGLKIEYVKDLRSFTKLIPALKKYPDDIIVTADDDIFYEKDWLEKLYKSYLQYPQDVQCHRVHEIILTRKKVGLYKAWKHESVVVGASYLNFLTGVGGVLYPPHALHKDVLKTSVFKKLTPLADDIWFWAMAVKNNVKIRNVEGGYPHLKHVNADREHGILTNNTLANQNVLHGKNDTQLANVLQKYPEILANVNKEIKQK